MKILQFEEDYVEVKVGNSRLFKLATSSKKLSLNSFQWVGHKSTKKHYAF